MATPQTFLVVHLHMPLHGQKVLQTGGTLDWAWTKSMTDRSVSNVDQVGCICPRCLGTELSRSETSNLSTDTRLLQRKDKAAVGMSIPTESSPRQTRKWTKDRESSLDSQGRSSVETIQTLLSCIQLKVAL